MRIDRLTATLYPTPYTTGTGAGNVKVNSEVDFGAPWYAIKLEFPES
jgi:hypothetical protein